MNFNVIVSLPVQTSIVLICSIVLVNAGILSAPQAYVQTDAYHQHAPATIEYHHHHLSPDVEQLHAPAVGTSTKSITRSFDGTVSHITKAVDTPFSSVRKSVSKVSNNVYKPVVDTAPAAAAAIAYSQHQIISEPSTTNVQHIAYSPATLVSHFEFDGPYAHYTW